MITIYGYTKCSTVKKGLKFLENNNIEYRHVDNVVEKLTEEDLKNIHEKSNEDIKKMFNTSGIKYRELNLKDKLVDMTLEEKYALLATDGMLVKRPILITEKGICFGFKEPKWTDLI